MPGSIPAPNSGSLHKNKENTGSQMGRTKNNLRKKVNLVGYIHKFVITVIVINEFDCILQDFRSID